MSKKKKFAVCILIIMTFIGIFCPLIVPYDVNDFSFTPLTTPNSKHFLGTDEMGHDIFSMLLFGFRITLFIALTSSVLSTFIGTLLGVVAAYYKGFVERVIMRLTELFIIIPEIVIILFFAAFSKPKVENTVLAIAFFSWSKVCRIVKSKAEVAIEKDIIKYTILLKGGIRDIIRKMWVDIYPAVSSMFILQCSKAAVYESTLSYFGIGDPLLKTWGRLIKSALNCENVFQDGVYLWYLMPPVICLCIFVITIAFLTFED